MAASRHPPRTLNTLVRIFGVVNVIALAALAAGSYWLNLVSPLRVRETFYWGVANAIPGFRNLVSDAPATSSLLSRPDLFLLGYLAPIVVSTAAVVAVLLLLRRHQGALDPATTRLLFGFAVAAAVVSAPGAPILNNDMFGSLVWGRMVRAGVNPFYQRMEMVFALDTPLESRLWRERMTYGPLWALMTGAIMGIARGSALWGAVLLKVSVTVAWIGTLFVLRSILKTRSLWDQCLGMLLFGWFALGPTQIVGDGRNDAFVTLLLLLWVRSRHRNRPVAATLALAASVGIKYATAPLFLIDLLHHLYERRESLRMNFRRA